MSVYPHRRSQMGREKNMTWSEASKLLLRESNRSHHRDSAWHTGSLDLILTRIQPRQSRLAWSKLEGACSISCSLVASVDTLQSCLQTLTTTHFTKTCRTWCSSAKMMTENQKYGTNATVYSRRCQFSLLKAAACALQPQAYTKLVNN